METYETPLDPPLVVQDGYYLTALYLLKTAYPTELLACLPILCSVVGIYHYTNLTIVSECVCESGRSTEAIRPEIKTNL